MYIPVVYQVWELFEIDPENPEVLQHGYFLTMQAVQWKLAELNSNKSHWSSFHVSELEFEDAFQQDMTNTTIH